MASENVDRQTEPPTDMSTDNKGCYKASEPINVLWSLIVVVD